MKKPFTPISMSITIFHVLFSKLFIGGLSAEIDEGKSFNSFNNL